MDPSRKKYELYRKQKQLKTVQNYQQWMVKSGDRTYKMIQIPLSKQFQQSDTNILRSLKQMESQLFKYIELSHSHLGRVKDSFVYFQQQFKLVVIAERDTDQDLSQFITLKGYNDLELLKNTMIDLAEAVAHLHSKNITHDNICLENVRKKKDKYVLVFNGFRENKPYLNDEDIQAINQSYYSSPEKYSSKGYDHSSDVWSLGILFLEMILGERIQEMSSDLPCKIPAFPEYSIVGRLSNSSVRQLINSMLLFNPRERINMPAVIVQLKKINFFTVDEYIPRLLIQGQNYYTFEVNLLQLNDNQTEIIPVFSNYNKLGLFKSITKDVSMSFILEAFSNQKRLRISVTSQTKGRAFDLQASFSYEHLDDSIRQCFGSIEQFFDQFQLNLKECRLAEDGILRLGFDRERCLALREIKQEESLSQVNEKSLKGLVTKKQTIDTFEEDIFFQNNQDIYNGNDIQASIEEELAEFEKAIKKKKKVEDFEGEIEIQEEQNDDEEQQWGQWGHGRVEDAKIQGTYENAMQVQRCMRLVDQSQELFAKQKFKQALQKELQVQKIKRKYWQPDSHIMQSTYFKLANRYLMLEQYDSSIKYCTRAFLAKKCSCSESLIMRKQSIKTIIQIYIMIKPFQQEKLNKWINMLKTNFPKNWKQIYLAALSHCLYLGHTNVQIFQFIFDKVVSAVDLSEELTSIDIAVSYTKIYREISLNSISEYYDFSFGLLAKAVTFFKKFPNHPLSQEYMTSIIKGFQIRLKNADMFYISAHYISRFIDEHMPEYKSQIMAGNIKYDGYNQNFIHNYHMMLRH